jgi:hypothetical protein
MTDAQKTTAHANSSDPTPERTISPKIFISTAIIILILF